VRQQRARLTGHVCTSGRVLSDASPESTQRNRPDCGPVDHHVDGSSDVSIPPGVSGGSRRWKGWRYFSLEVLGRARLTPIANTDHNQEAAPAINAISA